MTLKAAALSEPLFSLPSLSTVVLCAALVGCGKSPDAPAAPPPGGGMPPAEVGVVTVNPGDVGLVTELPGRLEASRVAQVRARVAGILQQRLFTEGADVKAGCAGASSGSRAAGGADSSASGPRPANSGSAWPSASTGSWNPSSNARPGAAAG